MFTFVRSSLTLAVSLVIVFGTHSVFAQYQIQPKSTAGLQQQLRQKQQQQQQQQQQTGQNPNQQTPQTYSGTIEAIGSRGMQIESNGTKYNIAPEKTCIIAVTGSGDASLLKPGMLVHFSGDYKKGSSSTPVAEIDVTSPQTTAAVHSQTATGTGTAHTTLKKTTPTATPSTAPTGGVIGQLKAISGNEITVETGTSGQVKAELSPTVAVKVDSNDPHLAQVGDKVEVKGYILQQPTVIAQEIKITLGGSGDKKSGAKPSEKPAATSASN